MNDLRLVVRWCLLLLAGLVADERAVQAQTNSGASELHWVDARTLGVEGKGWAETRDCYDRLPASAESLVPEPVWSLSHDSAGMAVRFRTDATAISARWTVRHFFRRIARDAMIGRCRACPPARA